MKQHVHIGARIIGKHTSKLLETARIVALTSVRPYKEAWPVEKALDFIKEQRGEHFDPSLVDCFLDVFPEILKVKERYAES